MLLQERVENHGDIRRIAGSALATTRIVTMFDEAGAPEIVDSFYRTSILPGAAVDNFHSGGVLFPIDITCGVLGPGMADAAYSPTAITHHPETGARVAGLMHPGWRAMSDLAIRLHRLFPDLVMPGWDIGFDESGAIAIEGNDTPGFSINRQALFDGLGGTRAFALLALRAGHWLECNEPQHSRWRARPAVAEGGVYGRPASHAETVAVYEASATSRSPSSSTFSPKKKIRSHNSTPTR
jgi:hypothetical protein